jgi:hypothetical protein
MSERITPWFGDWPPELKGINNMEDETDESSELRWWERLLHLWWLGSISAACFVAVSLFPDLGGGLPILLSTIGSSALVIWLLAGTVDWWLKKAILKDVFKAAVGYLLPSELKPEMEWVYKQDIIAIKHRETCRLTPVGNDLVIIRVSINRTFKNVSQHIAKMKPQLSIDEWFHKERESQIIEFGWTGSKDFECERKGYILKVKDKDENEITLAPKATIDTWCIYEEVKHINDEHVNTFIYATSSPFIEVEAFEGMNITVNFAMHEQHTLKSVGINKYELAGTLLPGQQIYIRWWRSEDVPK